MFVDHGLTRMSIVVGASACGNVLRSGLFAPTAMSNALCIFTSATVATILVHASMRFTFTTTHYRTYMPILLDMRTIMMQACPAYVFDYTCPSHCVQQSRFAQSAHVICGMLQFKQYGIFVLMIPLLTVINMFGRGLCCSSNIAVFVVRGLPE